MDYGVIKTNNDIMSNIFLSYNWDKQFHFGQMESGKQYMIYYVPTFTINNGSMEAIFTIRNSEGGHCKILINDYIVHAETSRFSYNVNMPFCLFKLQAINDYGSLLEVQTYDNINLYFKELN